MELIVGQVSIPANAVFDILFGDESQKETWAIIVKESRVPRAFTALLAGAGLAVSGLLMQTYFRNPLAGPSVLGITSGASLGVALLLLIAGGTSAVFQATGFGGSVGLAMAAGLGAMAVLAIILAVAPRMNMATLLIFGLMIGYITSSSIIVLQRGASQGALQSFVFWGMGSFAGTTGVSLKVLSAVTITGLLACLAILKHLNPMLLGKDYAAGLGVPVKKTGLAMLLVTGVITGVITAFCGPIAFLGLAVPHLARGLFGTSNHLVVLPATVLLGTVLGLGCDLITRIPLGDQAIPLNAVTSIVGAPIVLWVILKNRSIGAWV
ncbi:MAG: iron ABC transporter permease [Flavobacteriales bacterium]|nr:iron ABC transporter permease [Flavobacteriales bacterium]